MQIFKINQIIGFLVDYLHPVLLVYPDGFLPSKAQIERPLESLFWKKRITVLSGLLLISLDGTHSPGQSNILILNLT